MSELIRLSDQLFATGRRAGLLLLWLLLLGSAPAWAGRGPAAPSLAAALNPDGTLRAGVQGSFDASAFTMTTAPDGQPSFCPAGARRTAGVGDTKWKTGFGMSTGTSGSVAAIAVSGSTVYVGGSFTVTGSVPANRIAKWSANTWTSLGTGSANGVDAPVTSLAFVGTDLYVGGSFSTAGGATASNIAKWSGTAWSSVGAGAANGTDGYVYALAASGTSLYVGGTFLNAGGSPANSIAKWSGTAWSSVGTGADNGVNSGVYALAVSGSNVYVGGNFTQAGTVAANNVALWSGSAWSSLGTGTSNGVNNTVLALAVSGTDVYVGGQFQQAGTVAANYIAKWSGTTWTALGTGLSSTSGSTGVNALTVVGGVLYVGGDFTTAGTTPANNVAFWTGTAWGQLSSGVSSGASPAVQALANSASGLYVGGNFVMAGNFAANYIAKYDGSDWNGLGFGSGQGLNNVVLAVAVSGSNVYVGGRMSRAGNTTVSNIAKWNGSSWSALGSGISQTVNALAVVGTTLYAGGDFNQAGGSGANNLARWDGTAWSSVPGTAGNGLNSVVYCLATDGTNLYVGGNFTTAAGLAAKGVAKYDGSTWTSLGSGTANGVNGNVNALAVAGSTVYAGGNFTQAGGASARRIAKWDGAAWTTLGSGTTNGVDSFVSSLALMGTDLYVGGGFLNAGTTAVNRIAKWNGTAWSALGTGLGNGIYSSSVSALAVMGTDLYVGGSFATAGGTALPNIAKWDGTAWSGLGSGLNGGVSALAVSLGSQLNAGGSFTAVGDLSKASVFFGIYNAAAAPTITSFTPASGPVSTSVVITGTDFIGTSAVTFNGTNAPGFAVNSATQITVSVPSGASSGPISLTTPGGTATSATNFTVTVVPPPALGGLSPGTAAVNSPSFPITVTGTGFLPGAVVKFNGRSLTTTYVSPTELMATVITSDIDTIGTYPVVVVMVSGTSGSQSFVVTASMAARVSGINPTSGPVGTSVTISGSNLGNAVSVSFNGTVVSSGGFSSNTVTQIVVAVPTGATTGTVAVSTLAGNASGPTFTVTGLTPVITGASPGRGMVGDSVIITGTDLSRPVGSGSAGSAGTAARTSASVSSVRFGGVAASFVVVSATRIRATVPAGAVSGALTVTDSNNTTTNVTSFVVVQDLTVSTGTLASPTAVPAGVYNILTITPTGVARLTGSAEVVSGVYVQAGGVLLTNCQALTGAGSFTVHDGGSLGVCDAAGLSASGATGAVQTTGTRTFSNDALYLYNGSAAQVTGPGLPATVRELVLSNANGLALSQDVALRQALRLSAGSLSRANHSLTLLSAAAGTALVDNTGGSISAGPGLSRMQRYISPTGNVGAGYRHFGSPLLVTPIAGLATLGFTPILNTAYNTSATPGLVTPFPNVFGYDQARLGSSPATGISAFDKGWYVPATGVNVGEGLTVNVSPAALITFSGDFNGNATADVLLARGPQADAGWHLLGNPFPAPFDLGRAGATTTQNVGAAVYVFESSSPYSGSYRTLVNGIGGGSQVLPAGQAFFIRTVAAGQPSHFQFNQAGRVTVFGSQPGFRRDAADLRPQLALALQAGPGPADAVHMYAEAGATTGADAAFDAPKLLNPGNTSVYALATDGTELAVQGLPALAAGTTVPLTLALPTAGPATFTATLSHLPAGLTAFLLDAMTGTRQDLGANPTYRFPAAAGVVAGRFALVFGPAGTALGTATVQATTLALYPNPARTAATLTLPVGLAARPVQVLDALGREVRRTELPASTTHTTLDLHGLPAGLYVVRCGTAVARLVVE